MRTYCIRISMKDNQFNTLTRQCSIPYPTDNSNIIFNHAFKLFLRNYTWENPLRSLGVRVDKLITHPYEQLSLFETEECEICVDIDDRIKVLTSRFGKLKLEKTSMSGEHDGESFWKG